MSKTNETWTDVEGTPLSSADVEDTSLLFYDLNKSVPGTRILKWPLNLLIVPYYINGPASQRSVWAVINDVCADYKPIPLERGDEAVYGEERPVPVTEMRDVTGQLTSLHSSLINGLGELGCTFLNKKYILENYSPHIKHKITNPLIETPTEINSVTLAQKLQLDGQLVSKTIIVSVNL